MQEMGNAICNDFVQVSEMGNAIWNDFVQVNNNESAPCVFGKSLLAHTM
jgi:hypothetical protein